MATRDPAPSDPKPPPIINRTIHTKQSRIDAALDIANRYGGIDGAHHKTWVIDQMVRALLRDQYEHWVTHHCAGDNGPNTYSWDEGIPP
jgi:hypothetical protein